MTNFEEKSCKVLGVILILLTLILGLQLIGCSCPTPTHRNIDDIEMKNLA
tara:strand:- start:3032 stop:3181 length:150 start_codon:yes stop_codon:yes gene_type:complete